MQCENCGYIFFQPTKKCACCLAPYTPVPSAFEIGQENMFTIFEMAPGEGGISSLAGNVTDAGAGLDDYSFTDDYGMGGDFGADENVLDLSDAEGAGFSTGEASLGADDFDFGTGGAGGFTSYSDDIGPNDFELDLSEALAEQVMASNNEPPMDIPTAGADTGVPDLAPEPEVSMDISTEPEIAAEPMEAGAALDTDFGGGGFDSEIEGLGFGFDESPAETDAELDTGEISLDAAEPEAEISMEPELELPSEEPALSLDEDEAPSLELPEEPSLELSEEPALSLDDDEASSMDLSYEEEDSLGVEEGESEGGIEFDLDSVDLDAPEEEMAYVADEEPEPAGEGSSLELEGLELEMESPEEPEDEDLEK